MPSLIEKAEALTREAVGHREKAKALASQDELTAEQQVELDEHLETAESLDAEASKVRTRAERLAENDRAIEASRKPRARRTQGDGDVREYERAQVTKHGYEDDPKRGFDTPRQFLMAVMENPEPKQSKDERIRFLATAGSDEAGGYSDAYGGVLVPGGFAPNLLSIGPEGDPIGPYVTRVPMTSKKISFAARVDKTRTSSVSGGLRVYRRAEADTVTASRMQMDGVTLDTNMLFGLSYATEEILMDSVISFVALLEAGFRDEFASVIINERLNGLGGGQFLGALKSSCLITITKETGQADETIVYENVLKVFARCWRPQMWLANQTTVPQLALLNQIIGTGGAPVWMPSAQSGVPSMLLGLPVFFTEYVPALGSAGDIGCYNWSQYLEGTYEPLASAESMHVRFVNHERAFKFWLRNDGRPWWNAALTPKNGDTLSPFVILGARSS